MVGDSSLNYNSKPINYRYNREHKIIVINGNNIILASIDNRLTSYFMADDNQSQQNNKSTMDEKKEEQNGKELVKQFLDVITKIRQETGMELTDEPNYLFIH